MKRSIGIAISILLSMSMLLTSCGGSEEPKDSTGADESQEKPVEDSSNKNGGNVSSDNSDEGGSLNEPGALPLTNEKVKLTVGIPKPASVEDMNTNWFTTWMEDKTNVDVEFIEYPSAEASTKLEVEVTSQQELPDMLWGFWISDIAEHKYGSGGTILDLLGYYESGSKYIKEVFESPENTYDMLDFMKTADGKMYSVGRLQEETHTEYFHKTFINKTWLDTLGLEVPKTTEELYQVLIAFRDKDPNGNNEKDEIPMVGATNSPVLNNLMNAFIYDNGGDRLLVDDQGKLSAAFTQDAYKEGLKFINKLVSEELLSPLSFTQDVAQLKQLTMNPDTMITGVVCAAGIGGMFTGRVKDYVTLGALEGPEGVAYTRYNPSFLSKAGQVTKYCDHPELAFRLMDFMWSTEASELQRYGELGVDWERASDGDVGLCENIGFKAARKFTPDGVNNGEFPVQNKWYNFQAPMALRYDIVNGLVDGGEDDYNRLTHGSLTGLVNKRPEKVVTKLFFTPEQLDELADMRSSLYTYIDESTARFAVGDMDIESEWDAYLAELNSIGLKRWLEIAQEAYDAKPIDVGYFDYKVEPQSE